MVAYLNASDNLSGVRRVTVNLSAINGSSDADMQNSNGIWQLSVTTTQVGNFSLELNATDGMNVLLNVTDRTAPLVTSARAAPDSIRANGIDNTTLKVSAHDFANVSSIRNMTINLSRLGLGVENMNVIDGTTWQLDVNTTQSGLNGSLARLPVNVTDARNNSNTSISILLEIKARVNATPGNRTSFNFTVDSSTFGANITIPASTSLSGELLIAPVDLPALGGLTSAGVALNLSGMTFNGSLQIEMQYNSSLVSQNESKLRLWFYNTTTGTWNITENSSVDTANRTVSGNTTHFSVFAPLIDATSPVISDVASSSITTSSATITWNTDEASQSLVKYGTASGSYTSSINDTSNVTSHSIQLTGLSSSTTYYFVVNSTDQSSNSNQSSEQSFTTSSTGSTTSSSGGGGGGGVSAENASNIEVKEKYDLHIFKDIVTSYKFTNRSNSVLFVNITGNINAGEITTSVEVLKNTSSLVNSTAPGMVYKNINIWVGTSGFATPRSIKEAIITFRVENFWLSTHSLAGSDVKMVKWDESKWNQLDTAEKSRNSTFTYYEAKTDSFSSFAITGLKGLVPAPARAIETATPTPAIHAETTRTPILKEEKDTSSILTVTTAVLAVITIMLTAMYLKRKKG